MDWPMIFCYYMNEKVEWESNEDEGLFVHLLHQV